MTGKVAAVVVAAGRGERAGGDVPKQYRAIAGEPMIRADAARVPRSSADRRVQPVIQQRRRQRLSRRGRRAGKTAAAGSRRRDAAGFGARRT